jgi:hypothetical protein
MGARLLFWILLGAAGALLFACTQVSVQVGEGNIKEPNVEVSGVKSKSGKEK